MSETRRQLFRTSILSVFGLMSVPVLVGCSTTEASDSLASSRPRLDPWIPVIGKATDGKWYIFELTAVDPITRDYTYNVWLSHENPPSFTPATAPNSREVVKFDASDWLNYLKKGSYVTAATANFFIGTVEYQPSNGVAKGGTANLLNQGAQQLAATWNEIGHQ